MELSSQFQEHIRHDRSAKSNRITSEPSRVCLCHNRAPNCLIVVSPTHYTLYPGETITISAAVVGQDYGTVSGNVYAQFVSNTDSIPSIERDEQWRSFSHGPCEDFTYTVYSSCVGCKTTLVLTPNRRVIYEMEPDINSKLETTWSLLLSDANYTKLAVHYITELLNTNSSRVALSDSYASIVEKTITNFYTLSGEEYSKTFTSPSKLRFPTEIYNYPLYINIELQPCPLGFTLHYDCCKCDSLLQQTSRVECDIMKKTISRDGSVWVGVYRKGIVAASKYCPLKLLQD